MIPQKALNYAYGIYKVYALTGGNKLKEREVRVGDRMGENVEVISGVEKGDRLALPMEGQELAMRDGASAKVVSGGIHEKASAASDTGDR
jgi:Fe2+ transport system protein FeoA